MAEGNGVAIDGMATPPNESAPFLIGGRTHHVPALTLWDLELNREDMNALSPEMPWTTYGSTVIRIISRKLKEENYKEFAEALTRSCSVVEARNLATQFTELLRVSGFEMGEAVAATQDPGTGTSTESPPNSPSPSETQT